MRLGFLLLIVAAATAGVRAVPEAEAMQAVSQAGPDLTRVLRAMALLKALMALAAAAAALWRLGSPARPAWMAAYALSCAAMAAGPGLIWSMAHVGAGALLLHGGLLATVLLLWRDPVVSARLGAMVSARRALIRARESGAGACRS